MRLSLATTTCNRLDFTRRCEHPALIVHPTRPYPCPSPVKCRWHSRAPASRAVHRVRPPAPSPASSLIARYWARGPQHTADIRRVRVPSNPRVSVPTPSQAHAHRPINRGLVPILSILSLRIALSMRPALVRPALVRTASFPRRLNNPRFAPLPRLDPHLHICAPRIARGGRTCLFSRDTAGLSDTRCPSAPRICVHICATVRCSSIAAACMVFVPVDAGGGELRAAPPLHSRPMGMHVSPPATYLRICGTWDALARYSTAPSGAAARARQAAYPMRLPSPPCRWN
ncbi:hypothetical protein B0H17DRAFT_1336108 [Mycena rosella]|uniref:Uncharacterized protein n=1 Tax=Mycena rosella TaxID=1033263 RepID=A0AAD7CWK2_MYCRO|nr:hypothetical protein B0H17DRAFT_1336108 [Mycena rosella]